MSAQPLPTADVATPLPSPSLLLRGAAGYIARHGFAPDHWAEPGERAGVLGAIAQAVARFELVGAGEGAAAYAPSTDAFVRAARTFACYVAGSGLDRDGWAEAIRQYEIGMEGMPEAFVVRDLEGAAALGWIFDVDDDDDDDGAASYRDLVREAEAHDRADDLRAWRAGR